MNIATLQSEFDRGRERAREAMSADDVVEIIDWLETRTMDFINQSPEEAERLQVGSLPKWS